MTEPLPASGEVTLRNVSADDLPIFYEQQRDPEAALRADVPSRNEGPFQAHWAKILADEAVVTQTILFDGQVAGNILSFERHGKREVGYWLGRDFWGRGIATRALAAFLERMTMRPLYGVVVKDHLASQRVLAKCGFRPCTTVIEFSTLRGTDLELTIFILE
jgi:RimJ/RimL family protein N-acetyltransferase